MSLVVAIVVGFCAFMGSDSILLASIGAVLTFLVAELSTA